MTNAMHFAFGFFLLQSLQGQAAGPVATGWRAFIVVAPWLTGGLAGAVLTYALNQRAARKKQPGVIVRTRQVDYSLQARDTGLKELRVSYDGEGFDNLLLFQVDIENISTKTVGNVPILITMSDKSRVVDKATLVRPLNRPPKWEAQSENPGAFVWDPGECKPGDSAQLRILIAASEYVRWEFRGSDDIVVVAPDRESSASFEADVRNVIEWIAFYILAGSIPLVGGGFQAVFILASLPSIMRYASKWRALFGTFKMRQKTTIFNMSDSATMSVEGNITQQD
jgi:hypothetical protein